MAARSAFMFVFGALVGCAACIAVALSGIRLNAGNTKNADVFARTRNIYDEIQVDVSLDQHSDDIKNSNAYYFREIDLPDEYGYYGRSYFVFDNLGARIVSEYDVIFLLNRNKMHAMYGDGYHVFYRDSILTKSSMINLINYDSGK